MRPFKSRINAGLERITGYRLVNVRRSSASSKPRVQGGLVEEFSTNHVSGWIVVPAGTEPVRVSLMVNAREVAATWATDGRGRDGAGEIRPFDFALRDIWTYCRRRDRLSVRAAGRALPIKDHGMHLSPVEDGAQTAAALHAKLSNGYVFGQTGRLQRSKQLDTAWQAAVLGLYAQVRSIVGATFGYDVFVIYGTLLGAVRDGGFIGHDLDFDAAFVSRLRDGHAAAAELREIAIKLLEAGLEIEAKRSALHIHHPERPSIRIDLFHLYFDGSETLQFPFGVAGVTQIAESDWQGTREIDFHGARVLIPANAEQMVEHIYGPGWRSPKPGFNWTRDRTKRDRTGLLPVSYAEEVYWSGFYLRHTTETGSPFFESVNGRADAPNTVIDIGCGDGRDALAFAAAGRSVLGLDRSPIAVQKATDRASDRGLAERVRFAVCDVAEDGAFESLATSLIRETDEPVLFYLRFFLHSIPEEVQEHLLTSIAAVARPGDMLAAEFRTDKDEDLAKTFDKHYRRYQNGPAFGVGLADRFGFTVLDEIEGRGLSPFGDEDPYLYRVVAKRR